MKPDPGPAPFLAGLQVADFSGNLAGPYCGQILADLGAEVVKVERPGTGDPARAWAPPAWGGEGTLYLAANRGKRSLALELGDPRARSVVQRLVARSDVVIQAFRPDVAERFGLTEAALEPGALRPPAEPGGAPRPGLVLCSITAYASDGPDAHRPGYDPLLQADSGLMSVTGPSGGPPVRVGTSVVDLGAGMWAAIGVLSALRHRDATRQGSHVRVSLQDAALAWGAYHLMGTLASGAPPGPMGSSLPMISPYGAFPTADGSIMIAAGNDGLFRKLCHAVGIPEVASDPRFASNPDRVANREALETQLTAATSRYPRQRLEVRLEEAGVPFSAIRDMSEVAHDPAVRAAAFRSEPHPRIAGYRAVAAPPTWDGSYAPAGRPPPAVGEHSDRILGELGLDAEAIARLRDEGVVG